VTALTVVVTVDPESQLPLELLERLQNRSIGIDVKHVFKGGEEALHHGVISESSLAGHAAADLSVLQQLPVRRGAVLPRSVWIRS
jgi:hypothetical protein